MLFLLFWTVWLGGCGGADREQQAGLRNAGIAALSQQEYEEAQQDFEEAISLAKGRVTDAEIDLTYYLAASFYLQGAYEDAEQCYSHLITYDKENADAFFLRGSVRLDMDESEKGLSDYRKATAAAKDDYELAIAIYQNLDALGFSGEAEPFLDAALAIEGDDAENYYYRGRIYTLLGQEDLAKTAFIRAMDKGSGEAGIALAQAYLKDGETESAKELISRYTAEEKKDARQSALAGRLLLDLGEYDKALAVYEEALEDEKLSQGAYRAELLKGQVAALEYTGDFAAAKDAAASYVEAYPADAGMVRELSFLNTR